MATITTTPPSPAPRANRFYRITVDQYEQMIETGILGDGDKVELIDGMLVAKMFRSAQHDYASAKITGLINRLLRDGWILRPQQAIRIPDYYQPEPDIAVLRGTEEDYQDRRPEPGNVALVIEVAATSLKGDRGKKRSAYAAAGITDYWIVNLTERQIEVCSRPSAKKSKAVKVYKAGQLVPVVIDGNQAGEIAVDDVLPRRRGGGGE
jgi:Uma2 family endonuclease